MPPEIPERVAVLENDVKHIKDDITALRVDYREVRGDVTALKVDVATIKENVRHLPTKNWAVGALAILVSLVGGLISIAPVLQRWVGSLQ